MLPPQLHPDALAANPFYLSLSTYKFPPRNTPPLQAAIDAGHTLVRSRSSLDLARLPSSPLPNGARTLCPRDDMPPYVLPRSSSLPAIRLRSASDAAPPPPLPPYTAEVFAYGTYVSPIRKLNDADGKEVLRDGSDDEADSVHEPSEEEQLDLMSILRERGRARPASRKPRASDAPAPTSYFDTASRHHYPSKRYAFHASRPAPPPPSSTPSYKRAVSRDRVIMTVDTSLGSGIPAERQTGLMSASSTSSSSGSDTELRSPLSSALYGSTVEGTPLQVEKTADQEGRSEGESRDDIDIFSALKWSRSATKVDAVPTLPPIPKMADLMEGLFSTVSTPEQDQSPGRNVKGEEGNYHHLLPSYTTSTSYPHLAQLASPFLHPRPAPSPPSLSLPTAVARTPTISKVQPIPSCFPSIEAGGHGGLCALGLVLEGDERAEIPARDTQVDGAVDDDPFRRSFDALSSTRTREALSPCIPPAFAQVGKHRTSKSAFKHRHRHSYLPYETYISSGEQFIPYTPPGQRRMAPLRSASEKLVPSSSGMYMGMSRSMSNFHLPYRDKGIGVSPSPPKELYSRFDPDNDGGSDATDRSTVGAGVNKSPIYRFGRTLTRTRSGWGALLKGRGGPHTPRLVPRDLQAETPYRPAMPRVAEQQPAKVGGAKLAGKLGLDKMEGRWLRMGLGRRKSSD